MLTIQELEALRGLVQINVNINLPKGHHMAYDQVRLPFSWRPTTVTPNQVSVGSSISCILPAAVTDVTVEAGQSANGLSFEGAGLITLTAPGLQSIGANGLSISGTPNLTTIDIRDVTTIGAGGVFAGSPLLSSFICTSLVVLANDINLANSALPEANVDAILLMLVSATSDGSTPWAGNVDLSGGTNAIPSAAGLASKATLEGRGATVTVNS